MVLNDQELGRIRNFIRTLRLPITTALDDSTKRAEGIVCQQAASDLEMLLGQLEQAQAKCATYSDAIGSLIESSSVPNNISQIEVGRKEYAELCYVDQANNIVQGLLDRLVKAEARVKVLERIREAALDVKFSSTSQMAMSVLCDALAAAKEAE